MEMDVVHGSLLRTPVTSSSAKRSTTTSEHGDRYIPSRRRLNLSMCSSPATCRTPAPFTPASSLDNAVKADYRRRLTSLNHASRRIFTFSTTPQSDGQRLSRTCTFHSLSLVLLFYPECNPLHRRVRIFNGAKVIAIFVKSQRCPYHVTFDLDLDLEHTLGVL